MKTHSSTLNAQRSTFFTRPAFRLATVLLSTIMLGFLLIIWSASYRLGGLKVSENGNLEPADSVPLVAGYRLRFRDGRAELNNLEFPYEGGSIIVNSDDPPSVGRSWYFGEYGFGYSTDFPGGKAITEQSCDLPGFHFLRISARNDIPPDTTLMVSLWYPVVLSAILPAAWLFRHRRQLYGKPKLSVVAALVGAGLLGALFIVNMDTFAIYYQIIVGGILLSCLMSFYCWRVERRGNPKSTSAGIWIVVGVLVALLLTCLALPHLEYNSIHL